MVQFSASVYDANDVQIPDAAVNWSSSDASVVTVDRDGLVTAVMNGSAQITARSGDVSASVPVTVSQVAARVSITPDSADLTALGQTVGLSATVYDANDNLIVDAVVSWSSSDVTVASVDGNGLVTAVGIGMAEISATSGSVSAYATMKVSQSIGRISLSHSAVTLTSLGDTILINAVVLDSNDTPIEGFTVSWSSSRPSVASVSSGGQVMAESVGMAEITASAGNLRASVTVEVIQIAARIALSPTSATLTSPGETVRITAMVWDGNDRVIPGATVDWSSSDSSVATVSGTGVVRAVSNGNVRIRAMAGGVSRTIIVRVEIEGRSSERQILVEFYNATDGPNWTNNTNWLSERPVGEWFGISTDADGRVTGMNLQQNQLKGTIPSSIGRLSELDTFWLPWNQLRGSIPSSIGNLRKMDDLDLRFNQLTGTIPSSLGNLDKLVELALDDNQLTGTIPSSFGRMSLLGFLSLRDNQLTGSIPSSLGQGRIAFFHLQNNRLSGSLPSFLGSHRWLQEINLANNADLSGPLPLGLADTSVIPHLRGVDISGTKLCAPLDEGFQSWLATIGFAGNNCDP